MSYTADPQDTSKPLDSDFVGLATPAEIRALKLRVNNAVTALEQAIIDMGNGVSQTGATNLATAVTNLSSTISAINTTLTGHLAANNPHNITKATVGLGQVNNFPATSSLTEASEEKYLLAKAAKDLKDLLDSLTLSTGNSISAINSTLVSHDTRITTAKNVADSAVSTLSQLSEDFADYRNRAAQIITGTLSNKVNSIAAGSTSLLSAYRTTLLPGIYTMYSVEVNVSGSTAYGNRKVSTAVVTPDLLNAGVPAGSNTIRGSTPVSVGTSSVRGAPYLEITSPTNFTFKVTDFVDTSGEDSGITVYEYHTITRITYTPL